MSDDDSDESADDPAAGDAGSEAESSERRERASSDDSPLSDLTKRVSRRRHGSTADDSEGPTPDLDPEVPDGPPPDPEEDPFEQMSVGEIDEETLWSSLGSDDTVGVGVDTNPGARSLGSVEPSPEVESVDAAVAREHVVPKDKYCQSCPYLQEPPELSCTHEGTEIVEVVDGERFRVRNCPMVERGVEPRE